MQKLLSLLFFLMLYCNIASAANITVKDCAIGGVAAGWHSSHHYLPEKFKKTALRDVDWVKSSVTVNLDKYPNVETVVGFKSVGVERISRDGSIRLIGAMTMNSYAAGNILENLYNQTFNKPPLYIAFISIKNPSRLNGSYEVLAKDMQTPRGIHLNSPVNDLVNLYGKPDRTYPYENKGIMYEYRTPESMSRDNYGGAGMLFLVNNGTVVQIHVYNTFGY